MNSAPFSLLLIFLVCVGACGIANFSHRRLDRGPDQPRQPHGAELRGGFTGRSTKEIECAAADTAPRRQLVSTEPSQGLIMIRLSTLATPGADQAARSASRRSAHERTVPLKMTSLPMVSTVIRLASISAARRNASSILRLISEGAT